MNKIMACIAFLVAAACLTWAAGIVWLAISYPREFQHREWRFIGGVGVSALLGLVALVAGLNLLKPRRKD
jgi:heme A synthase